MKKLAMTLAVMFTLTGASMSIQSTNTQVRGGAGLGGIDIFSAQ